MEDLEGKVAVITGAASGIGAATAMRLAAGGARLVLGDVEEEPLRLLTGRLAEEGAETVCVCADVSEVGDVEALLAAAQQAGSFLESPAMAPQLAVTVERPLVERPSRRGIVGWHEVPLADREGGVAGLAQHFGHGRGVERHFAAHVGKARRPVRDASHANLVVIAPSEQCRASGRTEGRDVKVGEANATSG